MDHAWRIMQNIRVSRIADRLGILEILEGIENGIESVESKIERSKCKYL